MGLPSGILWSPVNVDSRNENGFSSSPYTYDASYVSWANVDPHEPLQDNSFSYNWGGINADEPWYEGQPYGGTSGSLVTDNIDLAHDAARRICGGPWRMPSTAEFTELFTNCDFIDENGNIIGDEVTNKLIEMPVPGTSRFVRGIRLRSRMNGNIIFMSACGSGSGQALSLLGLAGRYWTSARNNSRTSYRIEFTGSAVSDRSLGDRFVGSVIRPVMDPP